MPFQLYSAGSNSHGQLALSHTDDSHAFKRVELPKMPAEDSIEQLVCGANHTLALTSTGTLLAAGSSQRNQLGPISDTLAFLPVELCHLVHAMDPFEQDQFERLEDWRITRITAAWETSFVVLSSAISGDVIVTFGANDWLERGVGKPSHPVSLISTSRRLHVLDIKAGPRHIVAYVRHLEDARESILGWGAARHGQLDFIFTASSTSSPPIAPTKTLLPTLFPIPDHLRLLDFALGKDHTALLLQNSVENTIQLRSFGSNRHSQLLNVTLSSIEKPISLVCTWKATHLLTSSSLHSSTSASTASSAPPQFRRLVAGSEHLLCLPAPSSDDSTGSGACREVWGQGWNEHGNLGLEPSEEEPVIRDARVVWSGSDRVTGIWTGNATSWIGIWNE